MSIDNSLEDEQGESPDNVVVVVDDLLEIVSLQNVHPALVSCHRTKPCRDLCQLDKSVTKQCGFVDFAGTTQKLEIPACLSTIREGRLEKLHQHCHWCDRYGGNEAFVEIGSTNWLQGLYWLCRTWLVVVIQGGAFTGL